MKDQVAIVGVGETAYERGSGKSMLALALEAARGAIRDAGLHKEDVDGICAYAAVSTEGVQDALGIPEVTWCTNTAFHFIPGQSLATAAHAVYSGACETALVVWASNHTSLTPRIGPPVQIANLFSESAEAYAAWASRYFHEYGLSPETLGLIAINSRTNASRNTNAAMKAPMTMDDYLHSRTIREPLRLFDMEIPVDSGNAYVLTTAERARGLPTGPSSSTPPRRGCGAPGASTTRWREATRTSPTGLSRG
jgi:acetyl-CoA acetyltransferase